MRHNAAAAEFAANAGVGARFSSFTVSDDSITTVSLRLTTDSDVDNEEYFVSPIETNQDECT